MVLFLCSLLAVLLSPCTASLLGNFHQIPIPKHRLGYPYNGGRIGAPVHIDVFMCLQCGDAKRAFPVMKDVGDHYGPKLLRIVFHGFPLPYTKGSFLSVQATRAVDSLNPNMTVDYMQAVFDNQYRLLRSPSNVSDADMLNILQELAEDLNLDGQDFLDAYNHLDSNRLCRHEWKMAITRGVYGSPWFFINDMTPVDFSMDWSLENWTSIIDPLLEDYEGGEGEAPHCQAIDPECRIPTTSAPCDTSAAIFIHGFSQLLPVQLVLLIAYYFAKNFSVMKL
ncbi:uncharacterized protein [Ptychodera flava]|uniref:uncharacterized protein n=1 Tax=Ptychodera flava TaxID=63121 RepID=UPI003969F9E4